MKDQYTFVLALWGTVVSTFLACVKLWELSRERPRLTTSYSSSSSPDYGDNQIMVHNTSKTPALITWWELTWADRRCGWTFFDRMEAHPDEGYCNIVVPAHSTYKFDFSGEDHFQTRTEVEGHVVSLYLRVFLAGRKSALWLRVWKSGRLSTVGQLLRKLRNAWKGSPHRAR